jgi:VCBS repeat-containing protein
MKKTRTLIATLMIAGMASLGAAQSMDQLPGYFALEDLDFFEPDQVEVDVDLRDAMIKAAAGAAAQQDENLARLLEGVKRVRVKVGSVEGKDQAAIRSGIEAAVAQLEGSGWYRMVTVREETESVFVMAREGDNVVHGLTVMGHDGAEELVLVNIAGNMDPELIGALMKNMDNLEDLDFDFGG